MFILHITRPTLCKYVKQGFIKIDSILGRTLQGGDVNEKVS